MTKLYYVVEIKAGGREELTVRCLPSSIYKLKKRRGVIYTYDQLITCVGSMLLHKINSYMIFGLVINIQNPGGDISLKLKKNTINHNLEFILKAKISDQLDKINMLYFLCGEKD